MNRSWWHAACGGWLLWGSLAFGQAPPAIEPALTSEELAAVRLAEAERIRAIESVYGSVVAIYGNDRGGGGSGVLYDAAGLAITNHHVVAGAGTEGWAGLADGRLYRWRIIGTDPGGDVAIIQLLGKDSFPVAPLGNSNFVRVGDFSMAMGNPFVLAEDQRPTVTLGIVSGVERFQEGAGNNMLVYGNCIQVDSSINPGNSGGPLFNMRGEVIGINGRGSFKERGRVNVGLGYAISVNQVKNFLPDLLATKLVQHGTLDAVFGNRGGEVICHTINLDSPLAKAGVQLGDKLLAFEGHSITSANQFTNLVSTYPAGWPCEVTYEHEGQLATAHVRLIALPYGPKSQPMPTPMPMPKEGEKKDGQKPAEPKPAEQPAEKPDDKKPAEEKPAEKQPDGDAPMPMPMMPMKTPPNFGTAGEVRDEKLNAENAQRIVTRWHEAVGGKQAQAAAGWTISDQLKRSGEVVGSQTITLGADGRFTVAVTLDGKTTRHGYDGQEFWSHAASGETTVTDAERLCRDPFAAQAYTLATMVTAQPLATMGRVLIDAGDKAGKQLAYRLKAIDKEDDPFYVWLSVLDAQGLPSVRLLKTSEMYDDEKIPAVLYDDWKVVGAIELPYQRRIVRGLAEQVVLDIVAQDVHAESSFAESHFRKPKNEADK